MSFHFLKIFHLCRANDLTEKKQNFSLPVCERITLNMITIVVEVKHKLALQSLFVIR